MGFVNSVNTLFRRKMTVMWRKKDMVKGSCMVFVMCVIMSMVVFNDQQTPLCISQPNLIFQDIQNSFKIAYAFDDSQASP